HIPFKGHEYDSSLSTKICSGMRPKFFRETPECFKKLAMRCMDSNPKVRPTSRLVNRYIKIWLDEAYNSEDKNEFKSQFLKNDCMIKEKQSSRFTCITYGLQIGTIMGAQATDTKYNKRKKSNQTSNQKNSTSNSTNFNNSKKTLQN
ncbi:13089_t:CDS:2, partial [Gigaspora margarita]